MKKVAIIIILLGIIVPFSLSAQKKVLDHSVYDSWQNLTGELLTDDGRFAVYNVNAQDGDGTLTIVNTKKKR